MAAMCIVQREFERMVLPAEKLPLKTRKPMKLADEFWILRSATSAIIHRIVGNGLVMVCADLTRVETPGAAQAATADGKM